MSNPRRIVPGATKLITRRTTQRMFLLTPDRQRVVESIYWYVTAVIAAEMGVELHAAQVLSNHMHEVLTDVRGELPRFLRDRNRLFANAVKVFLGWKGEVFSRSGVSCVDLVGEQAILDKIAYTLANAVEAGLAERPEDWPGVTLAATDVGTRTIRVDRPSIYFDPANKRWPAFAEISITVPRQLEAACGDEACGQIVKAVSERVSKVRGELEGKPVKSVTEIYETKHTTRATSYEKAGERNPTFAASGNRAEAARALHERRTFIAAYRAAMEQVRAGVLGVLFPPGTWKMHRELAFGISTTYNDLARLSV